MAVDAIITMQATTTVPMQLSSINAMQPNIVFAIKQSVDFDMKPSSEKLGLKVHCTLIQSFVV